jgi:hypothetical protein
MKIIIKLAILGFLLIPILCASSTVACTIISASNSRTVLFAGNQDWFPADSYLVVDKTGKFGVVFFAHPAKSYELVMMKGINEKGLSYDFNWIPKEKLIPHPERSPQFEWALITHMRDSSTVDEILQKILTYNFGNSIDYQIHLADKSGNAVVIYPDIEGELAYTRKPQGNSYLITTNFNHARREKASWSPLDYVYSFLFDGTFETADNMLSKVLDQDDLTVEYMASVLNATHRDSFFDTRFSIKTLFSTVFDLKNMQISLYYKRQFNKPFVLDVKKELDKIDTYKKVSLEELVSKVSNEKN